MSKNFGIFAVSTLLLAFAISSAFAGDVSGKINFKGAKPAVQMIKMDADKTCMQIHKGKAVESEQVVVNSNNTLQWVFVYVKNAPKGGVAATTPVTLTQKGCMYTPHVFGIMTNQPLNIVNGDPLMHNIHALPVINTKFNQAQVNTAAKMMSKPIEKKFDKPELNIKIKCDVHGWMSAYMNVMDNPYFAVSDDKGNFTIKGLPAGNYDVVAFQEKYGEQTIKVHVGATPVTNADFTYTGK